MTAVRSRSVRLSNHRRRSGRRGTGPAACSVEEAIATCHGQSPMEAGLLLMMLAEASGEAVADPAGPSVEIRPRRWR